MNLLKNMKVRTKIMLGYTICIILDLIICGASLKMIGLSDTAGNNRYRNYGETGSMIAMAYAEYNNTRVDVRDVIYTYSDDLAKQQEVIAKINKDGNDTREYLQKFRENLNQDDTELLAYCDKVSENFEEYMTVVNQVVEKATGGNLAGAEDQLLTEGVTVSANVEDLTITTLNALSTYAENGKAVVESQVNGLKILQMGIGALGVVIAIFFEVRLLRDIRRPLQEITSVCRSLADGDVNIEVKQTSEDEFGEVLKEMALMANSIREESEIVKELSQGDYTVNVNPRSDRDVLGLALKRLVEENNLTMSNIKEATAQVTTGSGQVASASQSLAQGTTEQASAIQQVSASIVEIAERTKVNASDASEANRLVTETKEDAVRGNEQMQEMIHAMDEINEASENISKIIKVIDDIAFQTNILALNAAVEAARAGTHGKGFAVVAEEVRNLAGKSASAASETAEMIEDSIRKVENGAKLAHETAVALEHIVSAVDNIVNLVNSIANASNEQATAVTQIDQAISQVSQVVQTNSATSEQCAAASEELANQAEKLRGLIGNYRLKETKMNTYFGDTYERTNSYTPQISLDDDVYQLEDNSNSSSSISLTGGYGKY